MIYLFRIVSDEDPDFFRDVVTESSDTFLELHQTLQKNMAYDANQLASFFITNELWEKEQEITLIDMMQDPNQGTPTMDKVRLDEYLSEINQRLIYVFDFFAERAFYMELIEMSDQTSSKDTPFVAKEGGDPPAQLAFDLMADDPDPSSEGLGPKDEDPDPDMFEDGMPEDY